MKRHRVVIKGIGAKDETYRTKHKYTLDQAAETRVIGELMYRSAWEVAGYNGKVAASPLVTGEVINA